MLKCKSCGNLLRLRLLGQPGWWNPIKWPNWEREKKTTEICDDLGSIQCVKCNKWEKSEGKVKLEGALPTAGSKEIKTGERADFARTQARAPCWFFRVIRRRGLRGVELRCGVCEWRSRLVISAWISPQRQAAQRWLLFTSPSQPRICPPCRAAADRQRWRRRVCPTTPACVLSSDHVRSQFLADSREPWRSNSPHCIKEGTSFSGWSASLSLIWFPSSARSTLQALGVHATTTTLEGNWF